AAFLSQVVFSKQDNALRRATRAGRGDGRGASSGRRTAVGGGSGGRAGLRACARPPGRAGLWVRPGGLLGPNRGAQQAGEGSLDQCPASTASVSSTTRPSKRWMVRSACSA